MLTTFYRHLIQTFYYRSTIIVEITRGSAIAEEPRDALRQLKYYDRFYRATACNATHGIAVGILSVRLLVRQMRVL